MLLRLWIAVLSLIAGCSLVVGLLTSDIALRWSAMTTFLVSGVVLIAFGIVLLRQEDRF